MTIGVQSSGSALAGLRVMDLSRVLAGPWAGQVLADLGADVLKVERPGHGDEARTYGLATLGLDGYPVPPPMHVAANRGKKSMTLDLSKVEGQQIVRDLARDSDVIIENFLPGTLHRFGLDNGSLHAVNPRLILCSLTGYGQSGPHANRPGYDAVFQASSGMMSVTGLPDEVPGGGPMKTGPSMVDVASGMVATIGILAALAQRERTGIGQHVDATLMDTALTLQSSILQGYLLTGEQPQRKGSEGNGGHPARIFACADGDIYVSAGHQGHFEALCLVMGMAELIDDPRFADNRLRFANRAAWNAIAAPRFAMWNRQSLESALVAAHVPVSIVRDYDQVFSDAQVIHRQLRVAIPNPLSPGHTIDTLASPVRLSASPVRYDCAPPELGEHTDEVLIDRLGFSRDRIAALRERKVI